MKFASTFLLTLVYSHSFAQATEKDTTASCIANWKQGEEKVLVISRHKESYESGKRTSNFNFSYEAIVSVLDSSKEGYTIKWVFRLPEEVRLANPGLAELMPVYDGMKMIFTCTPLGTFKELINWEEVRDAYVAMMEVSIPKDLDDTVKASLDQAKTLFNSKEMVESALIKEIQIYHAPYGGEFSTKGITGKTSLPNPLGPEPMPATVMQKIIEINPDSGYFKATINQEIDKQGAITMMENLFKKMNISNDTTVIKANEMLATLETFEIKDYCEYVIIQSTGWIVRMSHERTAVMSEMKQIDKMTIEIK